MAFFGKKKSNSELSSELKSLRKKEEEKRKRQKLKQEIFKAKHGKKVEVAGAVGKALGTFARGTARALLTETKGIKKSQKKLSTYEKKALGMLVGDDRVPRSQRSSSKKRKKSRGGKGITIRINR